MSDIVWSRNGEYFNDDSLADLISGNEFEVGDVVYFGTKSPPCTRWIDADDVIETIGNNAYDNHGEFAEDYPNVSDEAKKELDYFLSAWQDKNCVANFYSVHDAKEYELTEKDFSE